MSRVPDSVKGHMSRVRIYGKRRESWRRLCIDVSAVERLAIEGLGRCTLEGDVGCAEELAVCVEDCASAEGLRCGHDFGSHSV